MAIALVINLESFLLTRLTYLAPLFFLRSDPGKGSTLAGPQTPTRRPFMVLANPHGGCVQEKDGL